MDDNFKHRLKNWVDKREAQNRMRMKDITHVVDPGRIIPKEDKEVEDHNYYSKKIREYIQKRLEQQAVNKSENLNKKLNEEISKLHDDWTENNSYKDRDKLHSKMMLPYNSKERNAILKDLQTKVPTKIINGEKHYLLHRRHEPIKGNFVVHNQTTSYSTFPKEKMSEILGGGHIHSAWIPESKISYSFEFSLPHHAIKPNSGDGEEGEIIVGAGKYPIHENFFQTSTMSKPIYSNDSEYPIEWPENLKSNEWAVNKSEELDKGAKGDWQKEGYSLKYLEHKTEYNKEQPDFTIHTIKAYDNNGKEAGTYDFVEHHASKQYQGQIFPNNAYTKKEHQRKGLANAAYKMIEDITDKKLLKPIGENLQSDSAKAFWSQPNTLFGKKEKLDKVIISDDVSLNIKLPKHFNNMPDGIYDDGKTWMVHKKNGKIVGAIRFMEHNSKHNKNIIYQNDKIPFDNTSRIDYVWTHPDYRRQGIAKNLLLHAIKTHKAVESNLSASPSGNSLWQSLLGEKNINLELSKNPDFGHIGWIKS